MSDIKVEVTLTDEQKKAIHAAASSTVVGGYVKEIDQTIGEIQDRIRADQGLIARLEQQKKDIGEIKLQDSYNIKVKA